MYNLFFQPLVDILRYIYLFIVKFTGNYGVSLILLSVAVNIILRPISNWAAGVQDKERKIQGILAPQIAEIKRNYHGAEQHEELSELYKRYGYNPIYAVRSGLDLFIQLPLLTAAYIMLSSLDALNGQTFGVIKNLANPDNLFMGINILPVLMTVINFLATLTTKHFTKRERVQAFIIAILFLILLYDAPSALLIYWTMNNFIMLIKNFADVKFIKTSGEKISGFLNYRYSPSGLWVGCIRIITFLLMFTATGIYFYYIIGNMLLISDKLMLGYMYCCIVLFIFVFVWTLFERFLENEFSVAEFIIKSLYFISVALITLFYLKYTLLDDKSVALIDDAREPSVIFFAALLISYIMFGFLLPISTKSLSSTMKRLTDGKEGSLFFTSIISILIFLSVFSPSVIYNSDPIFFTNTLLNLIFGIMKYCILCLIILTIIWLLMPDMLRKAFAILTAFLVCVFLVNAFIFTNNTGPMDGFNFTGIRVSLWKDICSVTLSFFILAAFTWKKRITYFIKFLMLLSCAMVAVGVYCYINVKGYGDDSDTARIATVNPDYHNKLWSFSRDHENVIGIFLDMFTGDHLQRIINENPSLAQKLDGFKYFPDTIATGWATFYSTPSIYGGPDYKPQTLNDLFPNKSLANKFAEAYLVLPNAFDSAGYDVVIAEAPYLDLNNKYFSDNIHKSVNIIQSWGRDYIRYWYKKSKENHLEYSVHDNITPSYISIISLLRGIPFCIRTAVYRKLAHIGQESDIGMQFYFRENFLPQTSIFFMKDFVFAEAGKPKFKIIYNMLTHNPWHLSPNSLQTVYDPYPDTLEQNVLVDGILPEHYYTERHVISCLAELISSLKKLGVYDNTRIVIFSDHDAFDSWKLNSIFTCQSDDDFYPGRPNSLLLFKDFNSHGDLKTSDALMSCEDVPALLLSGIASIDGIPDIAELQDISSKDRVRTHVLTMINARAQSNLFNIGLIYEIKGTMFKKENWNEIYRNKDFNIMSIYKIKRSGM